MSVQHTTVFDATGCNDLQHTVVLGATNCNGLHNILQYVVQQTAVVYATY